MKRYNLPFLFVIRLAILLVGNTYDGQWAKICCEAPLKCVGHRVARLCSTKIWLYENLDLEQLIETSQDVFIFH